MRHEILSPGRDFSMAKSSSALTERWKKNSNFSLICLTRRKSPQCRSLAPHPNEILLSLTPHERRQRKSSTYLIAMAAADVRAAEKTDRNRLCKFIPSSLDVVFDFWICCCCSAEFFSQHSWLVWCEFDSEMISSRRRRFWLKQLEEWMLLRGRKVAELWAAIPRIPAGKFPRLC